MDPMKASQDNLRRVEAELTALEGLLPTVEADGKAFWDKVREVRGLLNDLHPIRDMDRERMAETLDSVCEQARTRHDEAERKNASKLENELNRLEVLIAKKKHEDFWVRVKEVSELFKTLRPMGREARDGLWSRLDALCERERGIQEKERKDFLDASDSKAKGLLDEIRDVRDAIAKATGASDLKALGASISRINGSLHNADAMAREDLDACWTAYKGTLDLMDAKRKALLSSNAQAIDLKVNAARTLLDRGRGKEAKDAVREIQAYIREHPLGDDDYHRVKAQLDAIWSSATEANRGEYIGKQRGRKEWLEARIAENDDRIVRIEREMDAVRKDIASESGEKADKLREELARKFRVIMRLRDLNRKNTKELEEVNKAILKGYKKR